MPAGAYRVTIGGNGYVAHETTNAFVAASPASQFAFSVIRWGSTLNGAVYDEVPDEDVSRILELVEEVNQESVRDMFCGIAGPLTVTRGPCSNSCLTPGRIVIRPNWAEGSSASMGWLETVTGDVQVNVFGATSNRRRTRNELKASLAHELFHAAFAYHVCNGDRGQNPYGFSETNCPFPDSLMANFGNAEAGPFRPSPQDKLAACLVYAPGTRPRNTFPDTNPN